MAPTADRCGVTVGYAFLTRADLPLWSLWERYFAGCPRGSYTVAMHTQATGEVRETLTKVARAIGGRVVSVDETVTGDLRFKPHLFLPFVSRLVRLPAILDIVQDALGTENLILWSVKNFGVL